VVEGDAAVVWPQLRGADAADRRVALCGARVAAYQVTVAGLEEAERRDGRIPDGAILLIRTRFSQRWPDAERDPGTAERGEAAIPNLRVPGLHPDAATWLVEQRDIAAIGIDTASIDYGPSTNGRVRYLA
jgi:kynurenine formamidase